MKRIIFTKLAGRELEDAIRYYEVESYGLGKRFRDEEGAAKHFSFIKIV